MDGVLIDAVGWHFEALNEALSLFGLDIDPHEHQATYNGLPTRKKLRMLADKGLLPDHLHRYVEAVKQERTLRVAATRCFPRVEHLLLMAWLKQRNISVGVATNSIRPTAEAMLGFAGILSEIDVLVASTDVRNPKPDPEIYLKAMSELGSLPENSLVVEDHDLGIQAARLAGCHTLKVAGPSDVSIHAVSCKLPSTWGEEGNEAGPDDR